MRYVWTLLALLACLAPVRAALQADAAVLAKLDELDRANPERARAVANELIALGDGAACAALAPTPEAFAALALDARRARGQIARDAGGACTIGAALQRLDDPDEVVRRCLVQLIGTAEERGTQAAERLAALEDHAAHDSSAEIRAVAIRGLARLDSLEACRALERLLTATSGRERAQCAQTLSAQPRAREIVVAWVQRALGGEHEARSADVPFDALELLLATGYGNALAETPSGGTAARDRAPFVFGARHPVPGVRAAAAAALQRFVDRARGLGDPRRADLVLGALLGCGLDDFDLLVERATLALEVGDDPAIARACAEQIRRRTPLDDDRTQRQRAAAGALLEGVAALALADGAAVDPALDTAAAILDGLCSERLDLRADERDTTSSKDEQAVEHRSSARRVAVGAQFEVVESRALVELYRVLALLAAGRDETDGGVLARARSTDELLLEAQCAASRVSQLRVSLDDLLTHNLGPSRLLFANQRNKTLPPARALELETKLAQVFANVTGGVPGFTPAANVDEQIAQRLKDPRRKVLLERMQRARFDNDLDELLIRDERLRVARGTDNDRRELEWMKAIYGKMHQREEQEGEAALPRQIEPSQAGLVLVDQLRERGRAEAARALGQRVRDDFEALRESFANSFQAERASANAETTLGGALMDLDSGAEAEKSFQSALARLEAIEKDPAVQGDEVLLADVRRQLSNTLVSLAVNANVKLRQPDKALEYFERAYKLQQNDFMRVLLACYRARAGRANDAREALRDVPVSPGNYYNLGCTYALLGERDLALDFLRRDLDELRGNGGSRERQKAWARGDPDLEALRDDPRFQALMRPADADTGK